MIAYKTDRDLDNVDSKGYAETLKEFIESINVPIEAYNVNIDTLEYQYRSGFSPHSHNRGGVDLIAFTTVGYMIGTGEHFGTSIEAYCDKSYDVASKAILSEFPELNVTDTDEYHEKLDAYLTDDYEGIAWRVRLMYNGDNQLTVWVGWDTDAPYFRWSDKELLERVIEFQDVNDLKSKLQAIKNEIEETL